MKNIEITDNNTGLVSKNIQIEQIDKSSKYVNLVFVNVKDLGLGCIQEHLKTIRKVFDEKLPNVILIPKSTDEFPVEIKQIYVGRKRIKRKHKTKIIFNIK